MNGNLEEVRYLVERGADVNKASHIGTTPFAAAMALGCAEITAYLYSAGAR
jgi:ankyrin repeat protein